MSGGMDMANDHQPKFQTNDIDDFNRPPSRQKEPSLALGIESEYGEEDDNENNKFTSEIVMTTGIPAPSNEFSTKYSSGQRKPVAGTDIRPPSRQKTPTKAVGLDDKSDGSNSPLDYETNNAQSFKNNTEVPKEINGRRI